MPDIAGIPAHPLLVHGAVVFIPLAVMVWGAWLAFPRLRPYFLPVAGVVVVAGLFNVLAGSSGEALSEIVDETKLVERHEELAEMLGAATWVFVVSSLVALLGTGFRDRVQQRLGSAGGLVVKLAAAVGVAAGVAAVILVVLAGHAGADAVWHDVGR